MWQVIVDSQPRQAYGYAVAEDATTDQWWMIEADVDRFHNVARCIFVAAIVAVVTLSLLPGNDVSSMGMSDKVEHVVAYALLGLAGGLAFPTRRAAIGLVVLLPLLGVALEIAQLLVPQRSSEVADAIADWIGAALTLLPILFVRLRSAQTR